MYTAKRRKLSIPRNLRGYARISGNYGRYGGMSGIGGGFTRGREQKFFDTALAFSFDATAELPATGQLVLIPQGVTESTRVGRSCVLKSIQMRMNLKYVPGASASAATSTYLYLIQDTQANGDPATNAEVFTGDNFASALLNMSNSHRFRIIKKWVHNFNPDAGVTTAFGQVIKTIEFYKKLNIPMIYSLTDGSLSTIRSNNLFLMAGSFGAGNDDTVTVVGNCRVRYSDAQ